MKRTVYTLLLLASLAAAVWARPLFLGETFLARDHAIATLPSRDFLGDSLAEGHFPEWWPGIGLGLPYAANPTHGATYPPAWIAAAMPRALAADLLLVLHAILGGMGVAFLSRRLGAGPAGERLAGAAFVTAGYVGAMSVYAVPLLTLAWTPWVAWGTERLVLAEPGRPRVRAGLVLGLLWGAQIASGDPAGLITSALVAVAIAVARTRTLRGAFDLLPSMAIGILVAAPTVLPALGLLAESKRAAGLSFADATVWSLHPVRLLAIIWPRVLGDPTEPALDLAPLLANTGDGAGWALGLFLGLPVFLCAFAAWPTRGARTLLIFSGILLLLALGRFTPLYGIWRWLFLPERLIRYPEKHLAGALVLVCALAGPGLTLLLERASRRFWALSLAALAVLAAGVAALHTFESQLLAALADDRTYRDVPAALAESAGGGATAIVGILGFLIAIALARRAPRIAAVLAVCAVCLPGVTESWRLQLLAPRDEVLRPPRFLAPHTAAWTRLYRGSDPVVAVPPGHAAAAALDHLATAPANIGTLHGIAYVPGYDPALGSRLHRMWDLAVAQGKVTRAMTLLGVEWAVLGRKLAAASAMRPVATSEGGEVILVHNQTSRPRAFVTPRWAYHLDEAALLEAMLSGDPFLVRLLGRGPAPETPKALPSPCRIQPGPPERVVIDCFAGAPSLAVLLDAWTPGWSVTVDGAPAKLQRVDSVARGVFIPAGEHQIIHSYRTPGLRPGLLISGATLVLLLIAGIWLRRDP